MSGRDPAAARWAVIQFVRLAGVALVLVGLLVIERRLFTSLPAEAGYVLVAAGLIDTLVAPLLLARR